MTAIPTGTKFVGIGASVPTPENKSSQNNAFQEVYTIDDLQESVLELTTPPDEGDVLTYTAGAPAWAPASGGSDYTETIVNITSAQIKSGNNLSLLSPTVGDTFYLYDYIIFELTHGNIVYDVDTATELVIEDQDGNRLAFFSDLYYFTDDDSPKYYGYLRPTAPFGYMPTSLKMSFQDGTGNRVALLNGNGTLRVKIYHKTITFGA